jgi:simple sugar transport system substrate-binding protein
MMRRRVAAAAVATGMALALTACSGDAEGTDADAGGGGDQTFYWINHGSASDPFWVGAAEGAKQAAEDLGVTVNQSFHEGDVAAEVEAVNAAISADADGIAVSSPKDGALAELVQKAKDAGIPVVLFNTDDTSTARDAYVGADLEGAGVAWATYLVDNDLVSEGDYVWMPVEVPGATYQTEEENGIKSVFEPLGIEYEVFNASGDPAQSLSNMTDYLSANKDDVDAIIGMGDLVMGNVKKVFDTAGIEPGSIPVVGWGNTNETATAVADGYVDAAMWQFPDAQGYMPISLLKMAAEGVAIGFDVPTMSLYEQDDAQRFVDITSK